MSAKHEREYTDRQREGEDVEAQARAAGTTPERVKLGKAAKPEQSTPASTPDTDPGQRDGKRLRDGYSENLDSGYEVAVPHPERALESADPRRSGVQPAPNKPGKRVDTPGREGENAWSEKVQNEQYPQTARYPETDREQ